MPSLSTNVTFILETILVKEHSWGRGDFTDVGAFGSMSLFWVWCDGVVVVMGDEIR